MHFGSISLPAERSEVRGEAGRPHGRLLTVVPVRTGSGLGQMENNKVSQQNLKVNWSGVLGRGGIRVTTGASQGPAKRPKTWRNKF